MNHGSPQPVTLDEFLLGVMADCDPDLLLVTAPLRETCDGNCDGICECDGENRRYGPGNPDWEYDRSRDDS